MFTVLLLLTACHSASNVDEVLNTEAVTLPDGAQIQAEVKRSASDKAQGMMYRDSLPKDRGMLFLNGRPERSAYWMANCKFPLDIIWLDENRKVVEISREHPGMSECARLSQLRWQRSGAIRAAN